jgi:allantoate deiminase
VPRLDPGLPQLNPEVSQLDPQLNPEVPRLVSGAGHDALAMADAGPMGMLFVRCRNGGISHSPAELVDAEDVAAAAAALLAYLHTELA